MYDFLKALFGANEDGTPKALTFDELEAKLTSNKDIKLVNLADGGYVSKDKFDAKDTELAGVKKQLDDANAAIKSYKDMDIEGIKKAASDWEAKYKTDTDALNEKLKLQERSHNTDMFLSGYKFTSKAARDGIRAAFEAKNFALDNGTFVGAKDYMSALMADEDYKGAFVTEDPPESGNGGDDGAGGNHGKPQFSKGNQQVERKPNAKPTLTELMMRKNANPNAVIKYD